MLPAKDFKEAMQIAIMLLFIFNFVAAGIFLSNGNHFLYIAHGFLGLALLIAFLLFTERDLKRNYHVIPKRPREHGGFRLIHDKIEDYKEVCYDQKTIKR